MDGWFGASWGDVGRVVLSTLAIYVTAVVSLRLAGRRTTSQMSAFDFVVTIAIGSIVANTALNSDPTYGKALTGLLTLLAAQQAAAIVRKRFPAARRLLDFSPEPLYAGGEVRLRESPLTAQITRAELHSRLRQAGVTSLEDVEVVVLEPNGTISILRHGDEGDPWREVMPRG